MNRRRFMEAGAALSVGVIGGSGKSEEGLASPLPQPSPLPFRDQESKLTITGVRMVRPVPKRPLPRYQPAPGSWSTGGALVANPMSIYPKYKLQRSLFMADDLGPDAVEITTDKGIKGIGFGGPGCGFVIEKHLTKLLLGEDPFKVEELWDIMWRSTMYYGRKGLVINAISAVDLALWDIIGKALEMPVYQLLGGETKPRIPAYCTGNDVDQHVEFGFKRIKLAVPWGPADGRDGLKKNVELVRKTREALGPDGDIMLDCYMALDVPYAIKLAKAVSEFHVLWMEEPVPPDLPDAYRRIKDAVPEMLITGGEHEFTRYGFRDLIEKKAVDILQPDIYRAGGLSELKKIAAMASAYGLPVIPHGVGAPTYHFVISTHNCPRAEFVDIFAQGGRPILRGEPVPDNGFVELSGAPGFGYDLDEEVIAQKTNAALIY